MMADLREKFDAAMAAVIYARRVLLTDTDAARSAEPNLMGGCYDADEMPGRIRMDESKEIQEVKA